MTLSEYRKKLKAIGFTIRIQTLKTLDGKFATYTHIESGSKLTGNVFTKQTLAKWKPLFDFIHENETEIEQINSNERIYGLTKK